MPGDAQPFGRAPSSLQLEEEAAAEKKSPKPSINFDTSASRVSKQRHVIGMAWLWHLRPIVMTRETLRSFGKSRSAE